jgi:hypothetical protein
LVFRGFVQWAYALAGSRKCVAHLLRGGFPLPETAPWCGALRASARRRFSGNDPPPASSENILEE